MRNKACHSRLLAFGIGVSCCLSCGFSALPVFAQSSSAQIPDWQRQEAEASDAMSSDEIIAALAEWTQGTWIRYAPVDCDAAVTLAGADAEFVQSTLLTAKRQAEKIEDTRLRGTTFYQIGKSYACINQAEKAKESLSRARADVADSLVRGNLLADMAEVYGSLGDIAEMNAILVEVRSLAASRSVTMNGKTYRPLLNKAAPIYAEYGQYRKLLELVNATEGEDVREAMMIEASAFLYDVDANAVSLLVERDAIAKILSMFDIMSLLEQRLDYDEIYAPEPVDPQNFSQAATSAEYREAGASAENYADQLRRSKPDNVEGLSSASVDAFIQEQEAVIQKIPEPLVQSFAYVFLADFLSTSGQPAAALPLFEASLQRYRDNVSEEAIAALSEVDDFSEDVFYEYYRERLALTLIRAGDFEQGYQQMQAFQDGRNETAEYSTRFWLGLARAVASPNFSLSRQQQLVALATAQETLPQIEDIETRLRLLIDIAEDYIDLEEIASARQLSVLASETYSISDVDDPQRRYSMLPQVYSEFLIAIGDYEQAIALSQRRENRDSRNLLSDVLSAQFVSAGEYELAEAFRVALPTSERRLVTGLGMVAEYQSKALLREARELATRLLEEVQAVDLTAEYLAGESGLYGNATGGSIGRFRERIDRAEHVLSLYLSDYSRIDSDVMPRAEVYAVGLELLDTIESDWLRSGAIEETLNQNIDGAIAAFERDPALAVPDNLLLRRAVRSAAAGEFASAVSDVERMRSPYVKTSVLTHIATSYIAQVK